MKLSIKKMKYVEKVMSSRKMVKYLEESLTNEMSHTLVTYHIGYVMEKMSDDDVNYTSYKKLVDDIYTVYV